MPLVWILLRLPTSDQLVPLGLDDLQLGQVAWLYISAFNQNSDLFRKHHLDPSNLQADYVANGVPHGSVDVVLNQFLNSSPLIGIDPTLPINTPDTRRVYYCIRPEYLANASVHEPLDMAEQAHNATLIKARTAPSPSAIAGSGETFLLQQENHLIYNGRGNENDGPHITLYVPAFATLADDLENLQLISPSPTILSAAANLCTAAVKLYADDSQRQAAIQSQVEILLGVSLQFHKSGSTTSGLQVAEAYQVVWTPAFTDSSASAMAVLFEDKNSLGVSGMPDIQPSLTHLKFIAQEQYAPIRLVSPCPCIPLSVAGPYLFLSGSILVDSYVCQPFIDPLYLGATPPSNARVVRVAKTFVAISRAVRALTEYYAGLSRSPTPIRARLFPNIHPDLVFSQHYPIGTKSRSHSFFRAKYHGEDVLVKCCETYNDSAHILLAQAKRAPKLLYFDRIPGSCCVAVMANIKTAKTAQDYYGAKDIPPAILDQIAEALRLLHNEGFVYGDLRRPNILVYRDTDEGDKDVNANDKPPNRAMLIDFDWARREGEQDAVYPALLNSAIPWAPGVSPGAPMLKQHDLEMFKRLNIAPYY